MHALSKSFRNTVAGAIALTTIATPAHALDLFDPTGPLRVAILARIATIAGRIYSACDSIAKATRSIQERQEVMFPLDSLDQIGSVFQTVRSLRDDLRELDDQYSLSFDAGQFRLALEGEAAILRSNWEALWGRPSGPSRDLEEYAAWSSQRRHLSASSFLAAHDQWQDAATSLAYQARASAGASAGRSLRLTAVAVSMGLQQATVANALAAERLDAAQEELDFEREEALLADALGDVLLAPFERVARQPRQISGVPDHVRIGGVL